MSQGRPVPVRLRDAARADIQSVVRIERASFSDPWSAMSFAALIGHEHARFVVAEEGRTGEVVGYTVSWHVVDEAELANIAVASDARRRGVGALLLDAALEDARAAGCAVLYLEVRASNEAALRLYESRGFEQIGRRRAYYRAPVEDALVMRRTL